jgi:hypothetical protein
VPKRRLLFPAARLHNPKLDPRFLLPTPARRAKPSAEAFLLNETTTPRIRREMIVNTISKIVVFLRQIVVMLAAARSGPIRQ